MKLQTTKMTRKEIKQEAMKAAIAFEARGTKLADGENFNPWNFMFGPTKTGKVLISTLTEKKWIEAPKNIESLKKEIKEMTRPLFDDVCDLEDEGYSPRQIEKKLIRKYL